MKMESFVQKIIPFLIIVAIFAVFSLFLTPIIISAKGNTPEDFLAKKGYKDVEYHADLSQQYCKALCKNVDEYHAKKDGKLHVITLEGKGAKFTPKYYVLKTYELKKVK